MASLEEMKNNIWFDKFLATKNLSKDDFDKLKDKDQLQKEFEDFVFEKDCDPHISTPEEEDSSLREEVKERLEQAQSLEYHPEGYHINEELDGAAYFCALRRLAISEDEITQENLQKHIKEESNRIATEYFCGLRDFVSGNQSQTTPQKQEKGKLVYFAASIGKMVEQNESKEEIYQKMFKGKFTPSEAQEKLVTNVTAQSNIAPVKKWLKVIDYTGKLMDKIQEYEKKHPQVSMVAGISASVLGVGMPYMAFRMSMVARNVYKEAKKRNLSFSQLVKDSKSRNQLIAAGTSLARIIPGGQFVAIAPAVTKVFKKQFREEVKTSAGKTGEALKKIWKSKGKEGWKDLWQHGGKTAAMVGGVVSLGLGAYGAHAYFGADSMGDEVLSGDDTGSDMAENQASQPEAPNHVDEELNQAQMSTPLREGWGNMPEGNVSHTDASGSVNEGTMDWQDQAQMSTPLREGWGNGSEDVSASTQETPAQEAPTQEAKAPEIDVNNLTEEQQHDIEMLFKRDPASANKLLGDGKWHSSAELAKMWEEGNFSDEMKLRMTEFAGERFDDAGHFVDANGNIDTKMEDMAKEWTAKHAETSKAEISEPEIQKQEGVNIDEEKALKGLNQGAESVKFDKAEIQGEKDQAPSATKSQDNSSNEVPVAKESQDNAQNATENNASNTEAPAPAEIHTVETDDGKVSYSIQEGENGYRLSLKGTLENGASKEIERQLVGMIHQDEDGVYHLGDQVASNEKMIHTYATRHAQQLTLQKAIYEDLSARSEAGELSPVEQNAMKDIGEKLDKYNLRETNAGEVRAHTNTALVVSKGGRQ